MDLNGDGHLDIISGSYAPGHLYIFHGTGNGEFAKATELLDKDGNKLLAGGPSEQKYNSDSLASVPFAADMDDDGDLDLLVGNIKGGVVLIENEGTATEPAFGERTKLTAGGEELLVPRGDAGPVAVDWDDDDDLDLVVGAGNGSVLYCENTGSKSEPTFAAPEALIGEIPAEDAQPAGSNALEADEEPTGPTARAKVCVTDYNRDGRLDLLVGDFSPQQRPEPDLTPEQIARRNELRKQLEALDEKLSALYQEIAEEIAPMKLPEFDLAGDERYKTLSDKRMAVWEELTPLEAGTDYHGYVWLYLRTPSG